MVRNLDTRLSRLEQAPKIGGKIFDVLVVKSSMSEKDMQLYREKVRQEHGDQVFFVCLSSSSSGGSTGYNPLA